MGVTPEQLELYNGQNVAIVDYTGQIYEGILHYDPLDVQYPIQIWVDGCCFITFLQLDDAESIIPNLCLIVQPCCSQCLPSVMLLTISDTNAGCSCLVNEAYILPWNVANQKYEFDYPGICDCVTFHAELYCSGSNWVCYLALKNEIGFTCVDGNHLNFPLDCDTMTGTAAIIFSQTGTCACGPCANDTITVAFSPLPS